MTNRCDVNPSMPTSRKSLIEAVSYTLATEEGDDGSSQEICLVGGKFFHVNELAKLCWVTTTASLRTTALGRRCVH